MLTFHSQDPGKSVSVNIVVKNWEYFQINQSVVTTASGAKCPQNLACCLNRSGHGGHGRRGKCFCVSDISFRQRRAGNKESLNSASSAFSAIIRDSDRKESRITELIN